MIFDAIKKYAPKIPSAVYIGVIAFAIMMLVLYLPWLKAKVAIVFSSIIVGAWASRTHKNRLLILIETIVFALVGSLISPSWSLQASWITTLLNDNVAVESSASAEATSGQGGAWVYAALLFSLVIVSVLYRKELGGAVDAIRKGANAEQAKADLRHLDRILNSIGECIQWHRDNGGAGGHFRTANTRPLEDYASDARRPENSFLNTYLAGLESDLVNKIQQYLGAIAVNTFVPHYPRGADYTKIETEWQSTNPTAWREALSALNGGCSEMLQAYDKLVSESRKILI